jgi:two-component system sensor histidine kinase NreB
MEQPLKILLLEDSSTDAELIKRFLLKERMDCEFRLAIDRETFLEALDEFSPGVILSDNSMPQFNASEALKISRQRDQHIPFIMVTGTMSEEFAASIIKQGADDYILKDRMNRLPAAIETALKQRKAEKEITDYKYALDQAYFVSLTDKNGIIQYANDNFCKISGFSQEELLGQDHKIMNAGYHSAGFIQNLWNTISSGNIWEGEFCNRAKDGSLYWVDTTIVPFLDDKGKPYQYLSMRTDITGRKKTEVELQKSNERFKYATEASSDIIWELNFETGEYRAYDGKNSSFGLNTVLGWQPGIDGKNIVDGDRERVEKGFMDAKKNIDGNLWKDEYRVHTEGNSIVYINNNAIFLKNEKGKSIKAIGAISDITEKKKLETDLFEQHRKEQLKITATALDAQEKERNAIGQELHDNVNQILLGTKLLLAVVRNTPEENLHLLESCIQNLQNAIDENRKIAHILVVPDFENITLLDQINSLTESMLKVSGLHVNIDSLGMQEKLLPVRIKLPVYRIAQEQCTNIIKYSEAHTVNIFMETSDDYFKMIIADDGIGMETNKKTTGIGLKNIQGRLSILNGKASILTAPGKGFTLVVSIPLNAGKTAE